MSFIGLGFAAVVSLAYKFYLDRCDTVEDAKGQLAEMHNRKVFPDPPQAYPPRGVRTISAGLAVTRAGLEESRDRAGDSSVATPAPDGTTRPARVCVECGEEGGTVGANGEYYCFPRCAFKQIDRDYESKMAQFDAEA